MSEIIIGNVHLTSDGQCLTIASFSEPEVKFSLNSSEFKEMVYFIEALAGSEFDRRRVFRTPVWESSGLSVRLRTGVTEHVFRPTDMSLTGIFVKLYPDDWIKLALDQEVDVILNFEGESQLYRAVVRRCEDIGYGLFFLDSMVGEQIAPPPGITRIVMELQRRWLARRVKIVQNTV